MPFSGSHAGLHRAVFCERYIYILLFIVLYVRTYTRIELDFVGSYVCKKIAIVYA